MLKLSIIVPIYKVEKYIERCARSLFQQTYANIEYIFVDDCSPDRSLSILKTTIEDYAHRKGQVRIVHHSINKGLTSARNSGLAVATGDYIAHCDSDDWVSPTMYEELMQKAVNTNSDVVYCDFKAVYKDHSIDYRCASLIEPKKEFLKQYMTTGWTAIWNMVARRQLYVDNNITSPEQFTYCEDFYLSVKLMFFASKIEKVNKCLYNYNRINLNSLLHTFSMKSINDELKCYSELIIFFTERGCISDYIKELSWKILKCKQELVINSLYHKLFMEASPVSHSYIWSCPFINIKMKTMMWMLSHRMRFVVLAFLWFRNLFR